MFPATTYFLIEKYVKTTKIVIKFMEFSFYFFPSSDMSLQVYFILFFFSFRQARNTPVGIRPP